MRAESLDIHTARSATNQRTYQNPEAQYRATFSQPQLLVRRQRAVLLRAMIMALSLLIAVLATVDATILTLLRHSQVCFSHSLSIRARRVAVQESMGSSGGQSCLRHGAVAILDTVRALGLGRLG